MQEDIEWEQRIIEGMQKELKECKEQLNDFE
jgi:hypothetical protein